jgi:hypothetical protein
VNASRTSAGDQGLVERRAVFFAFGACPDLAATDFGCRGFAATLPQDFDFDFDFGFGFGFGFFPALRVIFGMIVYT